MLDDRTAAALARELLDAELRAGVVPPLTERHPTLDVRGAYAVQRHGRDLRVARGAEVIGRKVGLTSVAMQRQLGVHEPDFGYLTDGMVRPDGAALATARLVAPRAEAEIALRLSSALQGPDVQLDAALEAIGEVAPALEVVDSRVADWRIALPDTIADNASSGMAVLGRFQPLDGRDLASVAMTMDVTRSDGSREGVAGRGDAVLGHPAMALAWLARALTAFGESLEAGDIVLSGAMAASVRVQAGDAVLADFDGLGTVSAHFSGGLA